MELIDKSALVEEIERRIKSTNNDVKIGAIESLTVSKILNSLVSFIDTLETKGSRLQDPRFPHLDRIVDRVFGAGNLESFEYGEAEQLVLLAKEELLKDLEAKEEFKIGETEIYLDDGGEPPYDGRHRLDLGCTEYENPVGHVHNVEIIIRKA